MDPPIFLLLLRPCLPPLIHHASCCLFIFLTVDEQRGIFLIVAPSGETDTEIPAQRTADLMRTSATKGTPMVEKVLGLAAREIRASPPAT